MFSNIGSLYGKPKEAERSDARLEIRRHDPDHERRKKEREREAMDELFSAEETPTLSIQALRTFLENFLQSLTAPAGNKNQSLPLEEAPRNSSVASKNPERPQDGSAAQAASAYAHAYETSADRGQILPQESAALSGSELPSEDVRTIHSLLSDLKILSDRGIEYLKIERDISFLQSLSTAVHKLKSGL